MTAPDLPANRQRLEFALRRNRRRLALPAFMPVIEGALGKAIDFGKRLVDLEVFITYDSRFDETLGRARRDETLEIVKTRDRMRISEEANRLFSQFHHVEFLVLFQRWTEIGALQLTGYELEQGLLPLLEVDGDTVYGGTSSLDTLFLFDRFIDRRGDYLYEANYWTARQADPSRTSHG